MPDVDPITPLWGLHDDPDRPLDRHALICSCTTCEAALHAQAVVRPRTMIGLKTEADRLVVTLEYLSEVMRVDRTLAPLLYVADDHLREIFVPVDWSMEPRRRWWSMVCRKDEADSGRPHVRHRVAKRQSAAAARRRAERVADETPPPTVPVEFVPLANAVAPWRARHRALVNQVRRRALAVGQPLDADVVALVLAAHEDSPLRDPSPNDRWTRRSVMRLLAVDIFNWCSMRQVLHPEGVPEAVWYVLETLAATGRLAADSDPLVELRKPLRCYAGLDASGRQPIDDSPDDVPCECYVTYRGPTHGQLEALAADKVDRRSAGV